MIEMYVNWNTLHKHQLNCCGTQEYKDWVNTTYSSGHNDMLIFCISFYCSQRLVWQCNAWSLWRFDQQLGENVPDSCCLSTVIGCGLGVLSLSEEEVPFYCSFIFSNSLLVNFFFITILFFFEGRHEDPHRGLPGHILQPDQKQHRRRWWSWNWHWAHSGFFHIG